MALAAPLEWAAYTAAGEGLLAAEERLAFVASREKELYARRQADTDSVAAFQAAVEAEVAAMEKVAPIEWAAYKSALLEKVQLEFGALPKAAAAEFKSWSDAKLQYGDAWRLLREATSVDLDEYEAARAEARAAAEMLRDLFPTGWAVYKRELNPAILGESGPRPRRRSGASLSRAGFRSRRRRSERGAATGVRRSRRRPAPSTSEGETRPTQSTPPRAELRRELRQQPPPRTISRARCRRRT